MISSQTVCASDYYDWFTTVVVVGSDYFDWLNKFLPVYVYTEDLTGVFMFYWIY